MIKKYIAFFVIFSIFKPAFAMADIKDSVICLDAAMTIEREFNIPPHILSAIALTETGKRKNIKGKSFFTPTPWAINIAGKGHYFSTKEQAIIKVKSALNKGEKSIDVGCMQINLKYHGDAFETLSDAFDPYLNMRYAAEFVSSLYRRFGNWRKAVAHYHSATPHLGAPYSQKVEKNWKKAVSLFGAYSPDNHPKQRTQKEKFYQERMRKVAYLRAKIRQNTQ